MQQLREDIKNKSFHNIYLLYGEESYLVRQYRDQIKDAVLDGADEMNYSNFQGNNINLTAVLEIADTLPFFQEYRIIVLEDTGFFKTANTLADYLPSMPKSTIMVFTEKEVDKRNKLYKYVAKNGLAAELSAMNEKDMKMFIAVKLRDRQKKIRESTAEYLLERADNSLNSLNNELDKLIAYTYGREEITPEDIDAVCSVQVTGQIFKMLDAVASGRRAEVMRLYHDLLELQESPMSILYLLTRHFNILLQIRTMPSGLSKQEMAKKAGIPPFSLAKYQSQCRHFSGERLQELLELCADTELAFKQGRINDRLGVETLLVQLMKENGR